MCVGRTLLHYIIHLYTVPEFSVVGQLKSRRVSRNGQNTTPIHTATKPMTHFDTCIKLYPLLKS